MKKINCALLISALAFSSLCSGQGAYVAPPTSSTRGYVPVISDEMMERCVKVYNEAKWLSQELNSTYVNQYSQLDVDRYNEKAGRVNAMTNWFNANCAGKQSRSACEAANKLNRQKGLPTQSCR